jgi:hypothetical protein
MGDAFWNPLGLESTAHSNFMTDLFLDRSPGQKYDNSQLISMREMFNNNADMVRKDRQQTLNMEYDWKRDLINPVERDHKAELLSEDIKHEPAHLYAETQPWKTVEEFRRVRDLFDSWRINENKVLKSMADWDHWQNYVQTDSISKKGVRRGSGGILDQLKRTFLQAYANSNWGLPGSDYKGISTYLSDHGYKVSVNDLKNAKRRKGVLIQNGFPRSDEVMKFVEVVCERHPSFDWEMMVEAANS